MIILASILLEVATIIKSIDILTLAIIDSCIKLADNGYKFKDDIIKSKEVGLGKKINLATLLIPGLNIIITSVIRHNIKNNVMDNEVIKSRIIPMTTAEKEIYSELVTKEEKLSYIKTIITDNDFANELYQCANKEINDLNSEDTIYLENDQLFPISYTLDEVKKISSVANGICKIGKLDDSINIAIVGVPKEQEYFEKISFKREEYQKEHKFDELYEIGNKRFVIYPYNGVDEEKINNTVNEIIEVRKYKENTSMDINKINDIDRLKEIRKTLCTNTFIKEEKLIFQKK